MNFDEFQNAFVLENRKLKLVLGIVTLMLTLIVVGVYSQKQVYLYQGKEVFNERLLAVEVCRLSFEGLIKGEPNPHLIEKGIMDIVSKDPFIVEMDKVLQVKSIEEGACKYILKSGNKLLAFKISLKSSNSYPFYYKLSQVDELPIKEDEL